MIRLLCLFVVVATAYKTASKFEKLKVNLEIRQGSCATAIPLQSTSTTYNVSQTVTVGTSSTTLCKAGTTNPVQIFYKYTPPAGTTQSLAINTFGSGYDTLLAAWSCSSCAGTPLTCIDDAQGTLQSAITISNVSDCVYLAVAGYGKAVGKLVLTVQATATTATTVPKSTTTLAAALPTTCPSDYSTIVQGAACAVTTRCDYQPVCCCPNAPNAADRQCSPTLMFTCTNGAWGPAAAAQISCSGATCPSSVCPDAAPTSGACNAGQTCNYNGVSCCPDYNIFYGTTVTCSGVGAWNVTTHGVGCPPCPGTDGGGCPATTPPNGSGCTGPLTCNYDMVCCCGVCFYSTTAMCQTTQWGIAQALPACPCRTSTATPPTATPPTATPPTATSLLARS